jgi:amino acid adenylation domain-containing protein
MKAMDGFAAAPKNHSSGEIVLEVPATDAQQEIWLAIELGGEAASLAYNLSSSLRIAGQVDPEALAAAYAAVIARHDALTLCFGESGANLRRATEPPGPLAVTDLRAYAGDELERRVVVQRSRHVTEPFDLRRGPLCRAELLLIDAQRSELIVTAHHSVIDGFSMSVIATELAEVYSARVAGRRSALNEAPSFAGFAVRSRRVAQSPVALAAERYWQDALGKPSALELPTDAVRPAERAWEAERIDWLLSGSLLERLKEIGKRQHASLAAVLLGALHAFLARLTGQTDVVIALPAAGQTSVGYEGLVGQCVSTLPLRLQLSPEWRFDEQLQATSRALLSAFEHRSVTLGSLLPKLELPRDPSRAPLTPVLFNLDSPARSYAFGAAHAVLVTNPRAYDAFELAINAEERRGGLNLEVTYASRLFSSSTIRAWLDGLTTLLEAAACEPGTRLSALPVLSEARKRRMLVEWNATELPLPNELTALALVEAQVQRSPKRIAVEDAEGQLSYEELNGEANALAWELQTLGVGEEDRVGIAVSRGRYLAIATLAAWKAGAAYVPLDPDYPEERLAFIAEDAGLKALLLDASSTALLPSAQVPRVRVDAERASKADAPSRVDRASRLAYVLHTSGSTGQPKGVQIEQGALLNFLVSMAREPGIGADDVLVAVTTLSFDIAGLELFLPLTVGAKTVIAPREVVTDGSALRDFVQAARATFLQATPATWRLLVEAGFRGGPGFKALCGGDALPRELGQELLKRVGFLYNVYGPTETTVWSTCARVTSLDGPVTIGRPIGNTTVYVLDSRGEPVPVGAVGELYIGGLGVARGYLNRPDLTQERFVPDPFSSRPGAKLYRTGDLARFDAEGRLYFERRNDGQVKVRGHRIELGEIEAALERHPEVRQACVLVREFSAGDARLVAYVVTRGSNSLDVTAAREHLGRCVPAYMLPQHVVSLERMPLTPNGKVDRKALPMPAWEVTSGQYFEGPRGDVEQTLARIWAELLRAPRVGRSDGFFEMGGHSMLAARMLGRVREALGVTLPLRAVFQAPTLQAFAERVQAALHLHPKEEERRREAAHPASGGAALEEVEF